MSDDNKIYLVEANRSGLQLSNGDPRYAWLQPGLQFKVDFDYYEEAYHPVDEDHQRCYFYESELIFHDEWFKEDDGILS